MRPCICRGAAGYWDRAAIRLLTDAEEAHARAVGEERFDYYKKHPKRDYLGRPDLVVNIEGARAELAFCILFGVPWPAYVGTFRAKPDVEPDIEIELSRVGERLRIRPKDIEDRRSSSRRFVLLTPGSIYYANDYLVGSSFFVHGWMRPTEAIGGRLEDPGHLDLPAYFIDREELHRFPMSNRHEAPAVTPASGKLVRTERGFEFEP